MMRLHSMQRAAWSVRRSAVSLVPHSASSCSAAAASLARCVALAADPAPRYVRNHGYIRTFSTAAEQHRATVPPTASSSSAATAPSLAAEPAPHPPPPKIPPSRWQRLGAAISRPIRATVRANGFAVHHARARPFSALLLLLSLLGLGVGMGLWRRARLRRERELRKHLVSMPGYPTLPTAPSVPTAPSPTVPAFVMPRWAEDGPPSLRELAALLNAMPQLILQLRDGTADAHERPLKCERSLSKFSSNNALTPPWTPAQALERLRLLLHDDAVLDVVETHVPPSALVEPLVSLLVQPNVAASMSKHAAACLNAMTSRSAALCEQMAAHSTIDALVALAHYTDFTAWNYVYLLQQEPERVRAFQAARRAQQATEEEHHPHDGARLNPLRLPEWLLPFHASSASTLDFPATHLHPVSDDADDPAKRSLNCNASPAFALQQHFAALEAQSLTEEQQLYLQEQAALADQPSAAATIDAEPRHPQSAESQLIQLLLGLPLVSQEAQREQLGSIVAHLLERGRDRLAASEAADDGGATTTSLAQVLKEEVLQVAQSKAAALQRSAAVALMPTLHSSLAGDDLALVKEVYEHWRAGEEARSSGPSSASRLLSSLQRFLSRHTYSYSIGAAVRERGLLARQAEVYYHAMRALATLATDPRTAARIVQQDGVRMLFQVYARYPHELRVQIQVARALANLLQHCPDSLAALDDGNALVEHYRLDPANSPAPPDKQLTHVVEQVLAWSSADRAAQSRAAYTAIAHSGFLPLLVHWAQHALHYTDAAPRGATTTVLHPPVKQRNGEALATRRMQEPPTHTHTVLPRDIAAASDPSSLPGPATVASPLRPSHPTVSISTRPTDSSELHAQIQRIDLMQQVQHKSDETPSLPIPPPKAQVPSSEPAVAPPTPAPSESVARASRPSLASRRQRERDPANSSSSWSSVDTVASPRKSPSAAVEPLPTQLPHHPESSASLRNKLQLQSFRALVNLRSVLALNTLADSEVATAQTTHFPVLQDEVYLFYPLLDTLVPSSPAAPRESRPQQYSKQRSQTERHSSSSLAATVASVASVAPPSPLPPPRPDVDIVFIHGLMGNPLRTWRLHSMHDRTIGWIPNVVDERVLRRRLKEKRRRGDAFADAEWSQSLSSSGMLRSSGAAVGDDRIRSSPAPGDHGPDVEEVGMDVEVDSDDDDDLGAQLRLSPLDLHLSNVVSSAPLPPPKEPATMSKVALNVAARVLPASVVTRAVGVDRGGTIDPSPAASMAPREPTDFPMVPPGGGTDRSLQNTESDKESVTSPAEQQRQKDESSTMDVRSELEGSDNADPSGSDLLLPHSALHASQHSLDVETLWPRDWLPDAFPTARITSLGYSTSLTMKSTGELHSRPLEERAAEMAAKLDAAGVGQDGRRVVWVVHSMGGLIVKQILLQLALAEERHRERAAVVAASGSPAGARRISSADEEGVRSPLLRQTAGVVFYSTPHMGTWIPRGMLSHQNMLSNAFYPSYELLDLQNIGKLRELNAKFKTHVVEGQFTATHHAVAPAEQSFGASASSAPLPTLSLGEGVGTPLLHLNRTTQRVVSWRFVMPDSSRPGFGEFLYFPTQNHLTICKPKTMLDENYTAVRKFIAQAIRQSGAQAGQPTTPDQETTTHATSPATKQGKLPHN